MCHGFHFQMRWTWAIIIFLCSVNRVSAQDEQAYFTHDFENLETYPQTASSTEQTFTVPYGEWIYYGTTVSNNTSYLREGMGSHNLRMPKNGSYVILPILDRGAKTLTFNEGRGGRTAEVYTSTDGGKTWMLHSTVKTASSNPYMNTIAINNLMVNRIKIQNSAGKDIDVDNITVTIMATGTKATMTTGEASDITQHSATVSGTLTDTGDKEMIEYGICWSEDNSQPTIADQKIMATTPVFTVQIDELYAGHTYYYRAYGLSGAGTGYGEVKSFTTVAPTMPAVSTKEMRINRTSTDHQTMKGYTGGTVTDTGGDLITEAGVVFAIHSLPTTEDEKGTANSMTDDMDYNVILPLLPNTTYYYRAYAINGAGTAYGEEKTVTTGDLIISDFTNNIIYCSPDGNDDTGDGSEIAPFYSLQRAADMVQPGDSIIMMAGTYIYDARVNLDVCGTADKPIALYAKGGRAILDFSAMPYHKHSDNPYQGVRLTGSYWHFYRIDITNASDNGLLIERNKPVGGSSSDIINATEQAHHNIIEECNFYKNGDTGLQMKNLAAYNKVINCDAYLNCDEDQGDADGFAPKLSVGDGNYFYGCRAWLNSDDGWDVFYKKEGGFGDDMTVILENCISYKNGFLDENTIAPDGNGNGFKMGSKQGAMNLYMNRCLAICNKSKGFDQNHNSGDIILNNCTGMTLKSISEKSYSYRIFESIAANHEVRLTNCIAINDNAATNKIDSNTGLPKAGEDGKYGEYGRFEVDESLTGLSVVTCEFQKADPTQFVNINNYVEVTAPRLDNGALPESTYAHLNNNSFLVDAGTVIESSTYRGIAVNGIDYAGSAPDLGAYETNAESTAIAKITNASTNAKKVKIQQTESGIILLDVIGGTIKDQYTARTYDLNGQLTATHPFRGGTTALTLPSHQRVIILTVEGKGMKETIKINLR